MGELADRMRSRVAAVTWTGWDVIEVDGWVEEVAALEAEVERLQMRETALTHAIDEAKHSLNHALVALKESE